MHVNKINFIGVFLAGIVSMVIALLLIAILCCVCVGLKITRSRAKSR